MRLILAFLALAQVRLSKLDLARSDMLADQADEALRRGEERMRLAFSLAERARLRT
ncbi:MAG: hypothetical protein WAP03_13770 [Methylorubrum rhodinum]|uniref:hypothetical protein n=1 Tax=Methylorubrum rhodinum TaxID=29428 RepID=UPI003BB132E8